MSKATNKYTNRLANETSPYLLQHAHNPVDWYPWGEEALDRARVEDKPILLSIGYSACHWCHVMEHESFEDESTAAIMNGYFINIKVDREERPDLDEIYMKAVQMLTGHGGWPMTVFLTPELKPFYGGTYFPPNDRHGMPSFKRVLASMVHAWSDQREEIDKGSEELANHMNQLSKLARLDLSLSRLPVMVSVEKILSHFDKNHGGFGGAPKFPQPLSLALICRGTQDSFGLEDDQKELCRNMLSLTLNKMADGGIHDQIGGGFARYSVDAHWLIPHFEKMLYDNGLLATAYAHGYQVFKTPYYKYIVSDILDFVLRELTTQDGAFYSSLDADSEGEEGKFYVWRPDEIIEVLGEPDGKWLNEVYGITENGNFEHGTSNAHLVRPAEELAQKYNLATEEFWTKLGVMRAKLLEVRNERIPPGRDEKVLTSWNALMINGFVDGYKVTFDERYRQAARKATEFLLKTMLVEGRLLRTWGRLKPADSSQATGHKEEGQAKLNAYLDDYAYFINALVNLASIDSNPKWLANAKALTDKMIELFFDEEEKSFYYTSIDHEELLARPKTFFDGATPSATSEAVFALVRMSKIFDNKDYAQKAEQVIGLYMPYFEKTPDQFAHLAGALDMLLNKSTEIVLLGDQTEPEFSSMLKTIHNKYLPNAVVIAQGTDAATTIQSPLLEGRTLINNKPTVYVCQNYTCNEPITDHHALSKAMEAL
jgi:uncharacterized protein YyaL (SSP411 family)